MTSKFSATMTLARVALLLFFLPELFTLVVAAPDSRPVVSTPPGLGRPDSIPVAPEGAWQAVRRASHWVRRWVPILTDRRQLPSRDRAAAELQKRQDGTSSNTAPIGIIVGGVIGSLTVLAILGFAIFFVWYRGRKQLKQEELRLRYQSHTKSLSPAAAAAAAATASWPPSSVSSATVLGAGTPGMTHDPIMPKYWGPWSIHTGLPGPGSDRASYVPPPLSLLGAASSVCGGRASTIAVAPGSDGLIVVDHGTSSSSRRVHHLSMPPMPPPAMPTELDALDSAIDRPTTASSRLEGGTSRRKQLPPLPREAAKRAAAQRRASMHVRMLVRAKKG
ncbi:hypothetical protein RB601_008690 [Gaeumannomyces tritici]